MAKKKQKPRKIPTRAQSSKKAGNSAVKISGRIRRRMNDRQRIWLSAHKQEAALAKTMTATDDELRKHDAILARAVEKMGIGEELKRLRVLNRSRRRRISRTLGKSFKKDLFQGGC